jgi:hypothetical protein
MLQKRAIGFSPRNYPKKSVFRIKSEEIFSKIGFKNISGIDIFFLSFMDVYPSVTMYHYDTCMTMPDKIWYYIANFWGI